MKTKIFTLLLALLTANSLWAYDFQIDDFNFRVINQENRTLEVYAKDQDIEEADIPETVTYNGTTYIVTQIRGEGFANCSNLTSITIPNSVSHIGDLAFSYCTSLKVIKLFVEGRHLSGEDNEDDSNDDDDESGVIVPPCWWCGSAVKIAPRNFAGQEASLDIFYGSRAKVTTVILGDGVTYIPEGLCQSMVSLTSINIPNSVTSIEKDAFYDCSSLASITLPDNLTSIGESAFGNCTSLESITIPDSVTNIGNGAFSGCSFLKSIILPNSVRSIGEFAFASCSSLESITIPDSVTNIEDYTFASCSSLKYITIPNSVTSIGECAFASCSSLKYITIPNSVTSIGEDVCFYCKNLEEIYCYPAVPPAVGDPYFYDFNYNSVTLYVPCDSKEAYEEHPVFGKFEKIRGIDGCGEYVTTHIYDTICQGEVYEFGGYLCDATGTYTSTINLIPTYLYLTVLPQSTDTIIVEANDTYTWHDEVYTESGEYKFVTVAANGCDSIEVLYLTIIPSDNPDITGEQQIYYTSSDGNIVNPTNPNGFGANIISNTYENGQGIITFDGPITMVGDSAFCNCKSLTSITIPNSVTTIGDYAFNFCSSLTSITLGSSVTNIGDAAFVSCYSLDTIYCHAVNPPMVESNTFINNDETNNYEAKLYVPCESLADYKAHEVWGQFENVQCIEEEQPQADNLYYRYVMNADNTVLSETLLTQESFDKFTTISLKGDQQWTLSKSYGAIMNGYSINMTHPNEDWLISPALDLAGKDNAILSFEHCFGPASSIPTTETEKAQYTIWVSNDFTGDVQSATWTQLNGMMYGTTVWQYVSSGNIEIPANYLTENCRVAWKYVCEDASAQWEIKNVLVTTPTNQVEVVAGENKYSGDITIPATTIFNGQKCDVVGIAEEAFYSCSALTSITLPNSVKHIGKDAFGVCYALEKTNFVGDIADWCDIKFDDSYSNPIVLSHNFYINNQEITELIIPNTVDSIPAYAFDFCKSFTSITIPNSVTFIGKYAFQLCSNVKSIFIPKSVKCIQEAAFTGGVNLQSMIVEEDNPMYDSRDNCNAIIETESNTLIAGCSVTNMPKSVIHIGAYAFSYQYLLNSIEVPDGIIAIGDNAYYGCGNATSIFIPNSVSHIGHWALYACDSLNSIVVEEGNSVYDSRNNCNAIIETATNSLIVACQNTVIPEGVTNIGEDAYFNCRYTQTSITIPEDVTNIEVFAFYYCSLLDTIYCYATTPPTTTEYAFENYDATLYVLCESLEAYNAHDVWSQFSEIDCIKSNKVETDTVVIDASTTSVTITWPTEIGADSYTIIITKDGEVFCTLTFDSEGRLLNIAFSPGRNGNHPVQYAEQAANGYRFTVTGLESGTKYNYTITTKDSIDQTISTCSGEFTTQSNVSTSVSDNQYPITDTRKEYRDGQLIILRDGVEYNAVGVRL